MERVEDQFISCPYNPQHQVLRSRIHGHIIRCEKVYPPLAICPYNATHRFPHDQIKSHIQNVHAEEQVSLNDKPTYRKPVFKPVRTMVLATNHNVDEPDEDYWDKY